MSTREGLISMHSYFQLNQTASDNHTTTAISLQNNNFNEQQHDDKTPSHETSPRQSGEENLTFSKHSSQDNSMDTEYSTSTSNRTFEAKEMFESPATMPPEHPNAESMCTLRPRLNTKQAISLRYNKLKPLHAHSYRIQPINSIN